ncbi:hypothetical protein GCM10027290_15130 [Micromonospora sonneratiae]
MVASPRILPCRGAVVQSGDRGPVPAARQTEGAGQMFSGDFEQIPYPVRRPEPDPATEPEPGDAVEPKTLPADDPDTTPAGDSTPTPDKPTPHRRPSNRRAIP